MSRENLRQLFLDFIDLGEDEEAWQRYLETYDDLLAEVKRLRKEVKRLKEFEKWMMQNARGLGWGEDD
jgi:hypothetical protein